MSLNVYEPAPEPSDGEASWDTLLDRHEFAELEPKIRELIRADIVERDALGAKKYGTRLRPHDGRNTLHDIYQEQLDALVYSVKFMTEDGCRDPLYDALYIFKAAFRAVEHTRRVILRREGR
jgi:hypothetical protein